MPSPQTEWTVDVRAFELGAGEQLLLTGPSGCGKSTLLFLIAGLLDPRDGRVLIGGTDIQSMRGGARDRYRGRTIGMLCSTYNLLDGFSAVENVMAALMFSALPGRDHRAFAVELLARFGIRDPDAGAAALNPAQQQGVAIARAVACEPALLLADDPVANLDPETARSTMEMLQETCRARGAALLCVSRDPALEKCFSRHESLAALRASAPASVESRAARPAYTRSEAAR